MRITIDELRAFSFSLKHSIHVKSMLRKRKIQTKTTFFFCWKTWATKQTLIENSFFCVSVWTKHGKIFPSVSPQKSPAPTPKAPRTPLAPSMDRSVLVADIALSSGNLCTSMGPLRQRGRFEPIVIYGVVNGAPTKWPKITVSFLPL